MNSDEIIFGDCLRRLRIGAGLTQEALAERAGLSVDSIASLERGRRRAPRPDTLRRLTLAIGPSGADRVALIGAATTSSATASLDLKGPGRLPAPAGSLIGRRPDLAAVIKLLRGGESRLVTLTGPGGVGKTRLAIAAAAAVESDHAEGAAFVSLAELRHADAVLPAIARALGVRSGRQPVLDRLRAYLGDRDLVLLLDTFEHLLPAGPLIANLIAACPAMLVLATSRAALGLRGEQRFVVPPLDLPPPGDCAPGVLAGYPAVGLFVARARAAGQDFRIQNQARADAVTEICRRLDGLPLPIEFAAIRAAALGPIVLAERLEDSLDALGEGARDLPDRQRSLRASFNWTYGLLPAHARALLARMAVVSDGGNAKSIEAVCGPGGLDALEVLVDFNLVQVSDGTGGRRFAMLGTTCEYAREQAGSRGGFLAAG
ncbi:MAG TPA: helix-turn-helix domain-containing protein [Streptosporangiaceae bacterium]|jgi:predicted ATPase/transcriptional regulator with XRE-family HTH domain|nr:helix-turn-helix domain-containing protein [Streptosporangiaceae bacterium]